MGSSEVEHEVKVFEGVPHGFAVLGDYEDLKRYKRSRRRRLSR